MNARLRGEIVNTGNIFELVCGGNIFECLIHEKCIGKTNIKIGIQVTVEGDFINNMVLEARYVRKAYVKRRGQR